MRNAGGTITTVASSPSAATSVLYTESLTSTFHPPASGWSYNLVAHNAALGSCGAAHATATIRVVTAPTVTSFTAGAPASSQGAGTFIQCATVRWTSTAGDPPATWAVTQTGVAIPHLPSARVSAPAYGARGQRVCLTDTVHSGATTTTLTLTGTNEAGSASRQATITWASGPGPGG